MVLNSAISDELEWPSSSRSFTCCKHFEMHFLMQICSSCQDSTDTDNCHKNYKCCVYYILFIPRFTYVKIIYNFH